VSSVFFNYFQLFLSADGVGWWNDKNHITTTPPFCDGLNLYLFHIRTYT